MKKLKELPLYRDTFNLISTIVDLLKSFPKLYRYNLGDKLLNSALLLLSDLSLCAKYDNDIRYLEHMDSYLANYQMMKAMIRICNEQQILTTKQISRLALHLEKIEREIKEENYRI